MTDYLGNDEGAFGETATINDLTVKDSFVVGAPAAYSFTVLPPPGDSYILKSSSGVLEWDVDAVGVGDVTGPISSQTGEVCTYSSATGKAISTSGCFASLGRGSVGTPLIPGVAFAVQSAIGTDQFTELRTTTASDSSTLRFVHNSSVKHNIKSDGNSDKLSIEDGSNVQRFAVTSSGVKHGAVGSDYTFPTSRGAADQLLTTDASGVITWENPAISTIIQSPDTLTFAQANDGNFIAESAGTEVINATPSTTIIKGGGANDPTITLRSGILSSLITTQGRNILTFGATNTRVGYDDNEYVDFQSGLIAERVGAIIRTRTDATSGAMIDAATQERVGYDASETVLTSPDGTKFMRVTNADMDLSWGGLLKQEITNVSTLLRGGLTNQSELLLGGSPFGMRYTYDGNTRLQMSASSTFMNSPSQTSQFELDDGDIKFTVNNPANAQFSATSSETYIASLDSLSRVTVSNTSATTSVAGNIREDVDAVSSEYLSPDLASKLQISNATCAISKGGFTRLDIGLSSTVVSGPSGGTSMTYQADVAKMNGILEVTGPADTDIPLIVVGAVGQAADLQRWDVDTSNVSRMDNLGNIFTPNSFVTAANATISGLDATPLNICPSTSTQLNLGYSGIDTLVKSSLTVDNSQQLNMGSTSASVEKPVAIKMVSNAVLIKGQVLKIVDVAGSARVTPVLASDPDNTIVFGVSLGVAVVGGDVDVAIGGLFECSVQNLAIIAIGDPVEKSAVVGQDGRIVSPAVKAGTFGVALTAGVGVVDGSVRVLVAFKKSEVF